MSHCSVATEKGIAPSQCLFFTFSHITSDGLALHISPSLSTTLARSIGCASCGGEDVEISADQMWKGWRKSRNLHPNLVWHPHRMVQTAAPEQLLENTLDLKILLFWVFVHFSHRLRYSLILKGMFNLSAQIFQGSRKSKTQVPYCSLVADAGSAATAEVLWHEHIGPHARHQIERIFVRILYIFVKPMFVKPMFSYSPGTRRN